jgi:hypothetical protein
MFERVPGFIQPVRHAGANPQITIAIENSALI